MNAYETRPTVTILAGNSDHRLTQQLWSEMVAAVRRLMVLRPLGGRLLFEGFTGADEQWQTACWVVALPDDPFVPSKLREQLNNVVAVFHLEAILWVQADRIVHLAGTG